MQNASTEQLRELMNQGNFGYHSVIVRAKVDDYMGGGGSDEVKFRYQAVRVMPIDYKEDNNMLLKRLQLYQERRQY